MASGTIAVDPSTPPQLGQPLNFIVTTSGLHGNESPRVQVAAYQSDVLVYMEARAVSELPLNPLGGAGSDWQRAGGPAHCVATLYYWDFHPSQTFVPLATVEFDAAGA